MPRRMNRSDRTSITSIALSLRATRIARHSWVNSSSTLSIRYLRPDRKSTRLNSSHSQISYAVFCLKKKKSIYSVSDLSECPKVELARIGRPTGDDHLLPLLLRTTLDILHVLALVLAAYLEVDKHVSLP